MTVKYLALALCLLIVAAGVCLPRIGARDFWPPDEARYGEVSRELMNGRPLAIPHINDRIYPDKPPGFFWTVSALTSLAPDGLAPEGGARLPSVLGALVLVLLAGLWAARIEGIGLGLLAGIVLLSTTLFCWQARYAQIDMLFAAFIGLMMAAFYRAWNTQSRGWCVVAFLLLFPAIFVKGPVALIGMLAVIAWALGTRKPRAFFNLGSLLGAILVGLLVAGWLFWASETAEGMKVGGGQEYMDAAVWKQTGERAQKGLAHVKPWYAYFLRLPLNLLPFFPLLLLFISRRVRDAVPAAGLPALKFCAVWMVTFFVVMSCFPGKREIYLLPVYPAFALAVAMAIEGAARAWPRPLLVWSGIVASLLFVAGALCLWAGWSEDAWRWFFERAQDATGKTAAQLNSHDLELFGNWGDEHRRNLQLFGALLVPPAMAALSVMLTRSPRAALGWAGLTFALAIGGGAAFVLPDFDPIVSRRGVGSMIRQTRENLGLTGPVGVLRHLDEGVLFYFEPPIPEVASRMTSMQSLEAAREVERFLAQPGAVIVAEEKNIRRLLLEEGRDFRELARTRIKTKGFILMGRLR